MQPCTACPQCGFFIYLLTVVSSRSGSSSLFFCAVFSYSLIFSDAYIFIVAFETSKLDRSCLNPDDPRRPLLIFYHCVRRGPANLESLGSFCPALSEPKVLEKWLYRNLLWPPADAICTSWRPSSAVVWHNSSFHTAHLSVLNSLRLLFETLFWGCMYAAPVEVHASPISFVTFFMRP